MLKIYLMMQIARWLININQKLSQFCDILITKIENDLKSKYPQLNFDDPAIELLSGKFQDEVHQFIDDLVDEYRQVDGLGTGGDGG